MRDISSGTGSARAHGQTKSLRAVTTRPVETAEEKMQAMAGGSFGIESARLPGRAAASPRLRWIATLGVALALLTAASVRGFAVLPRPVVTPAITTAAGTGTAGYTGDGAAASLATLHTPYDVAVDAAGNVYIADSGNHVVRKIDAVTGKISTVAGNGTSGVTGDGGPATSAELESPAGVAVDGAGNLYIGDLTANTVREVVASTGNIKTVAGNGTAGYTGDGGAATSAELNQPIGVTVDASGNLYIAEFSGSAIREVTAANGKIATVAGNHTAGSSGDGGLATSAELNLPRSVALDRSGNLYIADEGNNEIRKVDAVTKDISTVAGTGTGSDTGDGGAATAATINAPAGVALDSAGNLYIADYSGSVIREVYAATQTITTLAGTGATTDSGDGGAATSAATAFPTGLAIDSLGNLYIAETVGNRVRKVFTGQQFATTAVGATASQNLLLTMQGTVTVNSIAMQTGFSDFAVGSLTGTGCSVGSAISSGTVCRLALTFQPKYPGERSDPLVISYSSGSKLVLGLSGVGTAPLMAFSPAEITTDAGSNSQGYSGDSGSATSAQLNQPTGAVMDAAGNLYIADQSNHVIRKVTSAGVITTVAGNGSAGFGGDGGAATSALLNGPSRVALDSAGNLYIADTANNRVREVAAATGVITTVAGTGAAGYSGDGGAATSAELYHPNGVAVDRQGNLFLSDTNNNLVREVFASSGQIATIAGTGTAGAIGDNGPATSAELNHPAGLAVDSQGNLYIADDWNNRVREVNGLTGAITTVAGDGSAGYSGDGSAATAAELYGPEAVAVDAAGDLYIADENNERIRRVNASTGDISTVAGDSGLGYSSGALSDASSLASPSDVTLDGAGNLYIANPFSDTVAKLNITTAWRDFYYQPFKTSSSSLTETLWNIGNSELDFSGQVIGIPSYSQSASGGTDCSATVKIATTGSCTMQVVFTPQHAGTLNSSVVFTDNSNNAAGAQDTLTLEGYSTPGSQTITFTTIGTQTYGVSPLTLTATASSGLAVSYSVVSGPATLSGSTLTITGKGTVVVSASQGGNSDYYAAPTVSQTFTVNPAPLTVSADSKTRVYNTANPAFTATYTGLVNGDTSASIGGAPVLTTTATTTSPATTYTISIAKGTLNPTNYTLTLTDGTLTVTKATPTASWTAPTAITYGTALGATQLDATASVAGSFAYTPASGTVLVAGTHRLSATFTPADPVDYIGASATASITVNKAQLTVTADDATRIYKAANPTFTDKITGFVNSDPASVVSGAATLTTSATTGSAVGTYPITAAAGTLSASNYSFGFTSGTLTITKATPTVTWSAPAAITYGTALSSAQLDATASVPGSFAYTPALGTVLTTGAQTLSVTFTPTDAADYSPVTQTASLTVNKAVLTVTANDASRVAATANPTFSDTITGFVNGDTATVVSGAATFTTTATLSSPLGSYPITPAAGTLAAANYSFTFVNGTLSVTKATPVITWTTPSAITYGAALSATQLNATANTTGSFSYSPALATVLTAGTHTLSVTFTPSDTATFNAATQTVTLTVNPAVLTVTAQNATRGFGDADPTFTGVITGFVNSDTAAVVSGAAAFSTTATSTSPAGGYPITAAQGTLAAANYSFAFVNGTLTVTKKAQTISSFTTIGNQVYGGAPISLSATASSTLPITFKVLSGPATLSGSTLSLAGAGTVTVEADQAGDTDYAAASPAQQTFTVAPAVLTVTANNASRVYGVNNPSLAASYSGFVNGDGTSVLSGSPALTTTATTTSAPGTYPITAAQGTLTAANYAFNYAPGVLTVHQATPTITWTAPPAISYGTALSATQLDATANTAGNFVYTPAIGTVPAVGTQTLSVTFTPTDSTDYTTATQTVSLTVNQAVLTVTGTDATRVYGTPNPALAASITGFVNGDTSAVVSGAASATTAATQTSNAGTYAIVPAQGTLAAANYGFNFVNGTLTVTQASSSTALATAPASVTYGQDVTLTASATSTSGTPTGTVTFSDGTTSLGTSIVNGSGVATLTVSRPAGGSHSYTAVYAGDTNFTGSTSSAAAVTVAPVTTTVALQPSATAITYPANLILGAAVSAPTGPPTGTVTFLDGATVLGTGTLNGNGLATLSLTSPVVGTHSYTATYGGDANNATATSAAVSVAVAPAPAQANLSASSLSFAGQPITTTSSPQTVTLTNGGQLPLTITSVLATVDFTQTNTCGDTVAAGASCQVTVNFTPSATGARSGLIALTDTAGTQTISVTGQGDELGLKLTPGSLTFGSQTLNAASTQQNFTLTNSSSSDIALQSIAATGDYSQTSNCPATLTGGGSCDISVTFTPTAAGDRSGSVTVTAPAGSVSGGLDGQGAGSAAASLKLYPATVNFGTRKVGASGRSLVITVQNTTSSVFAISGVTVTGDYTETNTCGTSLAVGATCRVLVNFTPTVYGTRSGTLAIGSDATVGLTGVGSQGVLTLSPASLSFGSQQTGTSSAAQTVSVSNTGNAALTITSLSASSDFTENDTCSGVTLQAGASCSVNVSFSPQSPGPFSGTVGINSTAGPASIGVSGEGTAPGASLQPSSLAFGGVPVDTGSTSQTVTLTDTGTAPMAIQSITVDSDFTEQTDCPATLAAGAHCIINVSLQPTATGPRSGNLLIQDDAGLQLVALTGTGTNTGVLVTPSSLFFGSEAIGGTSTAQTVTVTNSGTSDLNISGIQVSGDFTETNTCPSTLAAGASCAVSVTLQPTTQGTRTGTLTINDNAAGGTQTVSLSGDGIPPGVNLQPAQVTFGSVQVGQTSPAQTVVLTNQLSVPMNVVSISGTGDFNVTNNCGAQLAAGATCTLSITVTPTLPGAVTGQIDFDLQPVTAGTARAGVTAHAAPSNQPILGIIASQGQASPAGLDITPPAVNFGSQSVHTTSTAQTVTVTNNGQTDLGIQSITATSGFAETNNCPATLTVGTACAIQVSFTPATTGNVTGSLSLTDDQGTQTVVLGGTGIPAGITVSPTSLSFAATVVGSSSAVQTVTLSNSSGGAYAISGISASGDFSQSNTCGASLASGAICTASVTFTPTAGGNRTGTLTIGGATPIVVPLAGTGNAAALNLSATQLDFGNQLKGSASAAQTLTVTNASNVAIAFAGVTASGDFSETTTCGSSLAPGSGCAVNVVFTPGATGSRTGTLTLTDGSPDSPQTVTLSGTGTELALAPSAAGESASIVAGQTATYALNLTASGFTGPVTLACSGGPGLSSCTVNPQQVTVSGNQPTSVQVTVTTATAVTGALPPLPGGGSKPLLPMGGLLAGALGLLLLPLGLRRTRRRTWVLAGALVGMALLLTACGTSDNLVKPSQPTQYTITVTATTATGATRTATLPLTVN